VKESGPRSLMVWAAAGGLVIGAVLGTQGWIWVATATLLAIASALFLHHQETKESATASAAAQPSTDKQGTRLSPVA
jgi:hypothetical protein